MQVTVYSLPNCSQCMATKRHMERKGIEFSEVDLSEHPDKIREFIDLGHSTAPIVTANDKIWSGYRHSEIEALATLNSTEKAHEN